jgi:hypothetical protein
LKRNAYYRLADHCSLCPQYEIHRINPSAPH